MRSESSDASASRMLTSRLARSSTDYFFSALSAFLNSSAFA
jgi:hypothetical protein